MKSVKNTLAGATLALGLSAAQASVINVGGVMWDPDAPLDFSSFSIAIHQDINALTGVVSGYGFVSTMNGTAQGTFCPGCEVTFTFGGFSPISGAPLPTTPGTVIGYTGGFVNVFVDHTAEITNPSDPTTLTFANTSDGNLWLAMLGHPVGGVTLTGTAVGFGSTVSSLTGQGLLDVIGGMAAGNFNTNTQLFGSDFSYSNSFTLFHPAGNPLNADGTGNFFGGSVPEPGSLALAGLGLLGLAAMRRRRQEVGA